MNWLLRYSTLMVAIVSSFLGSAQAEQTTTLDTVVVTANRTDIPVKEVLASTTVISREDIEQSQAPDLIDLLARQVGIDIARTGGPGQTSTVFMRGTNANHTLVLVDGIRVNTATQGSIDFSHLPLSQIDRIEIVRGPRAALWGSDAIGGVIHIFTRNPSKAYIEARAGSYGRAGIDAGFGQDRGETRFGLGAGIEYLRGFSATDPTAYSHDPDEDGYRNRHVNLRAQTALGSQRLAFTGLLTDADVQFDQGETAVLNREFGMVLGGELAQRWGHSVTLGQTTEDLSTPVYGSHFGSTRTSLDWVNTLTLNGANTLNIGFNWSRESGFSEDAYSGMQFDQTRRNAAGFAAWRGRFKAHTLELSLRRDDNSQFDGATTGNAAWGWQAVNALRVRASWGQGFRAPNFNELYYPGFFGLFAGNPNLLPEHSTSGELGLHWTLTDHQQVDLSAYRTRIRDLISFTGTDYAAVNVNRAAIDGIELAYHLTQGRIALDTNATWQNARDASTHEPLMHRPDRKVQLSASYRFRNAATLALDASGYSASADFVDDLPGYARFDLRAAWPLAAGWKLEGRIENLGNRDYQLASGYNTPGRSGLISLHWGAK